MKKCSIITVMIIVMAMTVFATAPTITDVSAQQRYPWNGKVDITYTVTGDIVTEAKQRGVFPSLKVMAIDTKQHTTNTATQLSGDVSLTSGTHELVWDMAAEGHSFKSSNIIFKVTCLTTPAAYCVIDLAAGGNASSYPITYLATPPSGGFNQDEYKTTKLVLRRIEPGTFIMGEDPTIESHRVILTKPFYLGIFEVTQKQWQLVAGNNPSGWEGDTRPVESVSYDAIRGSSNGTMWPSSSSVDYSSFIGKIRTRTGLDFDLPTEAQWEYACRAGTTSEYNNGGNTEDDLKQLGRYYGNQSDGRGGYSVSHTAVGSYAPNAWGLYDMHGNVWEWCLDWIEWNAPRTYGTDPRGSTEESFRVVRGGANNYHAISCTSYSRNGIAPWGADSSEGFRLARTLSDAVVADDSTICSGTSSLVKIDLTSGTRTATAMESIWYSSQVDSAGVDAIAVVEADGEVIVSTGGSGFVNWTPSRNGTCVLTHKVMSDGNQIGELLTATFLVEGVRPPTPTILPASGTTFNDSLSVSISCASDGATIHYTTDGSEPTAGSPIYNGVSIAGKTTVKAIAEMDGMLSEIAIAEYALGRCADPVIEVEASFSGQNTEVVMSCATEGAVIYYTLDGNEPNNSSPMYAGPFLVTNSCTIKAYAEKGDYFNSTMVTQSVVKVWNDGSGSMLTDVTAQQRYPWNGKVDISYTVTDDITTGTEQDGMAIVTKVMAIDKMANTTNIATQLSGDMALTAGRHSFVWDMDAEGLSFKSSNVVFRVECEVRNALYCVIDLSAGANALAYPITYLAESPNGGFSTDEYKATKLVLRCIEPGTFKMGGLYNVTLTEPFYMGIFEVTQKQYELVTGKNPSGKKGDMRPVEQLSWMMIRGAQDAHAYNYNWPNETTVAPDSFIGRIQARTGLAFDLPTEAQWEYACRAGTTSMYNNGGDSEDDLKLLGRYPGNWSDGKGGYTYGHTTVGSYQPNAWGLYDMYGNVSEWCLDWYGDLSDGMINPVGPSAGSERITRGGDCQDPASRINSSRRDACSPFSYMSVYDGGFRLALTRPSRGETSVILHNNFCFGESGVTMIDLTSGIRTVAMTEKIRYSTDWVGDVEDDAVSVIEVNGETLSTAMDSGYVVWTPPWNGMYTLTHKVMSGGEQVGETLTSTFVVEGMRPLTPVISPANGTMFDASSSSSLSVAISCLTEGATIHYTTDGSEPTAESPVYRRFRIYSKTMVKAIAEKDGLLSDVAVAEYAWGRCADPVISPSDGTESQTNMQVSIQWNNDGILRYTLDGNDPTAESAVYEGPFMLNESAIVKAKVFSDDFFDSAVAMVNLTRVRETVAAPQIEAETSFTGSKTKVSISCATDGAAIRYTLDGSEPESISDVYTGPFYVTDSCTVKAYAVMPDYLTSATATQEIVKVWSIGDTMGKPDHGFTTDGSGGAGWTRVVDATAPNGETMKSGAITDNQESVLETKVMGPGTLMFSWRTSCEDSGGQYDWDHAEFAVDGTVLLWRDGINSWTNESVRIEGVGEHTVTWTYKKDDVESDGDDAAYVAGYGWTSDYTETKTTSVPIPYVWLLQHDPEIVDEFEAYEAAAKATAANGYNKVWECYVAGISPTNEMAKFTAAIEMVDGVPRITWSPDLNTNGIERTYTIWGKTNLTDGVEWECPTNSAHRFFKVVVELP